MKRIILVALLALISIGSYAQEGKFGAGIGVVYGTEISTVGVGVMGQYYFNDHVRGEVGANIYAKNGDTSTWDANLNFHYLINLAKNRLYLYPLMGVSFSFWKFGDKLGTDSMSNIPVTEDGAMYAQYNDMKEFRFGPNIGLGLQFNINARTSITLEGRYQMIGDFNQGIAGLSIQRRF